MAYNDIYINDNGAIIRLGEMCKYNPLSKYLYDLVRSYKTLSEYRICTGMETTYNISIVYNNQESLKLLIDKFESDAICTFLIHENAKQIYGLISELGYNSQTINITIVNRVYAQELIATKC